MNEPDIFSVIFCMLILIYACYSDIQKRSVPNKLWLLMIAVGIPIAGYNMFIYGVPFLILFISSIFFTFALSYLLYLFFRFNLFGGADAKCLIGISVLIPIHPSFTLLFYHFPINFNSSLILMNGPFPFAITTLLNAAIVSLIAPIYMISYNFLRLRPKEVRENLSSVFIGYKLPIDALTDTDTDTDVKNKHVRLVHLYEDEDEDDEEVEGGRGDLRRKFIFGGVEIDKEVVKRLKKYHAQGKIGEEVWVTPVLPFMLFITSGFFISLFYGNLIFHILFYFLL